MSLPDSLRIASDGLVARVSGPWAREKLTRVDRYSGAVTTSQKGKWTNGLTFVDLMAGPGLCIDTRTASQPEFSGSTLRALNTSFPFQRVIAVESDPVCFSALKARVDATPRADTCTLKNIDCNSQEAIATIRAATEGALTLMFVDLLGTEVTMHTLRSLTIGRTVDLVITWPEMDVVRNISMMSGQAQRWTHFFGTDQWHHIATTRSEHFRLRAFQKLYQQQLRLLGYSHAEYVDSGMKNLRGRVLYRPLFASRDEFGLKLWQRASSTPAQQTSFEFG